MNDGLKDKHRKAIFDILTANPRVERVVLFGSRAMGTFTTTSDVDLALFGDELTLTDQARLAAAIDKLPMAQQVDLLLYKSIDNDKLKQHIKKHGKEWFRRGWVMSADWPTVKLSEIVNFKTGRLDSNQAEEGGPYPFFTCSPTTFQINSFGFDTEAVLLAGNNASGVFSVKYYNGKFNAYQRTYVITPKVLDQVSVRWLYFRIQHVTTELQQLSVGTSTKFLTKKILDAFEIALPSRQEQENIANILWSLQDKMDNNRQINQTLEEIAQAIFKSWFVDFEPVKAKIEPKANGQNPERAAMCAISGKTDAELDQLPPDQFAQLRATAALFPDELTDSELGPIPKGWETKRIDSILELAYGKALNKVNRKPGQVPVYGSGGVNGFHDKHLIEGPGIIVGRKGTVGSLHWEDSNFFPIDTVFYVVPKSDFPLEYIFYLLQTLGLQDMNTDAAVPGLNRNNVYRLVVAGHPKKLVEVFSNTIGLVSEKIFQIKKENSVLTVIRDTLLPKLLSGEISVGSAQAVIEEVE